MEKWSIILINLKMLQTTYPDVLCVRAPTLGWQYTALTTEYQTVLSPTTESSLLTNSGRDGVLSWLKIEVVVLDKI